MNRREICASCTLATSFLVAGLTQAATPLSTAFTYQGRLVQNGAPYPGASANLRFSLWNDPASTNPANQLGSTQTVSGVSVSGGLFTVGTVNAAGEFGATAFNGDARWLEIAVQGTGDPGFTTLAPRQPITSAPYALALPGLYTQQNATSPNLIGGSSGNTVTAGVVGATIDGGGNSSSAEFNSVTDDYGTVGGGFGNRAGDNTGFTFSAPEATVAGGANNTASALLSTVGGGAVNVASGIASTVGGGNDNIASGDYSTVAGGFFNTAMGSYSFGAGRRAKANHDGTFVWADISSLTTDFASTAPNQFLIRAVGGVGIGTAAPAAPLHVQEGSAGTIAPSANASLVLERSSHNYVQMYAPDNRETGLLFGGDTADIRGGIVFNSTPPEGLAFRTGGNTTRMVLDSAGNVGIGTPSPETRLHVADGTDASLAGGGFIQAGLTTGANIAIDDNEIMARNNGATTTLNLNLNGGNVTMCRDGGNVSIGTAIPSQKLHVVGNICATGTIGACSDARFKEHIEPMAGALDKVSRLRGVTFDWKRKEFADHQFADGKQVGFIAQEVGKIVPEVVAKGSDGYYSVDYGRLTPLLVEAMHDLRAEKDKQLAAKDAELASQKRQISDLAARLARLEAKFGTMK